MNDKLRKWINIKGRSLEDNAKMGFRLYLNHKFKWKDLFVIPNKKEKLCVLISLCRFSFLV
ncbi:hypothetical protein C2I06_05055 [Niallia circulans]|uniref:Uncharacterized protein n=1 Tax=Niallia circulans TaxID=1397 RepID=A0A268FIN6_NIACI|nr:hypothetical protein C2I06_05055 [Niallia circulans]AYV70895.1 hypothetical protein C2H98_04525 [Niallia circulans]PAD85235.1 hypothetical protein CHH57_00760 [Niallia circulans]UQZ73271.1 hypothetical protein C2I17_01110 [Niallia circulans]